MDRFDLYTLCAQAPDRDAALLRAIHGSQPGVLGEDFSGAAALARAWCAAGGEAVAVDHDPAVIQRIAPTPGLTTRCASVLDATDRADVIAATNFGVCEMTSRDGLLAYLRVARARLRPEGCLACDLYGGSEASMTGSYEQTIELPDSTRIDYTWQQVRVDPTTGRVRNAMHFVVVAPDGTVERHPNAFVYDWRLWSIAELRDAMADAGFGRTEVYDRAAHAIDEAGAVHVRPIEDGWTLEDNYQVLVVGRA